MESNAKRLKLSEQYFDEFPEIKTERLLLRKLSLADAADLQSIRSDEKVMKFMDSERHHSHQFSENFIAENLKTYEERNGIFWAVIERSSGRLIGDFAFWKIDKKNSRAEIGYTLSPEFWGQGFMKEAMIRILLFGFNDLNLHSFEANINPENENSRKLLKKLGFKKEAYFRENYYFNGKFLDSEIFCLLKSDMLHKT